MSSGSDNIRSSFSRQAWKRLRRNKGAMAGLCLIALAILLSIAAYWIAPDSTPYANRMVLEISGQRPGFHITMLAIHKDRPAEPTGFFQRLLYGKEAVLTYVPIRQYRFEGNDIIVQKYADEETTLPERYPLATVWYGHDQPLKEPLQAIQQKIIKERIL
ncbi:MAG TPA: ABC transporter permease, partial [Chitinophaga sp.]